MRRILRGLLARLGQYRIETAIFVKGILGLIVNLAYIGRLQLPEGMRIVVLVCSQQEALIFRILRLMTVISQCRVCVIRSAEEFNTLAGDLTENEMLFIATSHLYCKHYQVMSGLHQSQRLIVF